MAWLNLVKRGLFLLWLCLLGAQGTIAAPKVVGGTDADIANHPYLVALTTLQEDGSLKLFCAGTLLKPKWVLTAAHCLTNVYEIENIVVVAGEGRINQLAQSPHQSEVNLALLHANYSDAAYPDDIALLSLRTPLSVGVIEADSTVYAGGEAVAVIGWGLTQEGGEMLPNQLQQAELRVVSQNDCNRENAYAGAIKNGMVCAAGETGQDACRGDSGGPLLASGKQIGIVSWGRGCGNVNFPGVYTRLSAYQDWINEVITQNQSGGSGFLSHGLGLFLLGVMGIRRVRKNEYKFN